MANWLYAVNNWESYAFHEKIYLHAVHMRRTRATCIRHYAGVAQDHYRAMELIANIERDSNVEPETKG